LLVEGAVALGVGAGVVAGELVAGVLAADPPPAVTVALVLLGATAAAVAVVAAGAAAAVVAAVAPPWGVKGSRPRPASLDALGLVCTEIAGSMVPVE
jgi:hypothetical protein